MDLSHLRWQPPRAAQLESLGPGTPAGTARDRPDHDPVLTPRDWAIYLLHAAAEVEHALLVQYLYAAFSVNPAGAPDAARVAKARQWQRTLLGIAKEEMGHLITVQNLLLQLGGPVHFERESFPIPSEFYPFPFELEPLSKESLAKYVLAEMPENPAPPLSHELLARARVTTDGRGINRVGALYARLYCLFSKGTEPDPWAGCAGFPAEDHLADGDFAMGFAPYQADQQSWSPLPSGPIDPSRFRILIPKVTTREEAREALKEIGEQGEGQQAQTGGAEVSHFARFRAIYEDSDFPETDPELGGIAWRATHRMPANPNTRTGAKRDGHSIVHPRSKAWAQLFNFRYRLLLAYLSHYVQVDERDPGRADRREIIRKGAIAEMFNLTAISNVLVKLPLIDENDSRRAGPPFELPYTLDLPLREPDRWMRHVDVLDDAFALIERIRQTFPEDANHPTLTALLDADRGPLPDRNDGSRKRFLNEARRPISASGTPGGTPAPPSPTPTPLTSSTLRWPRIKEILNGVVAGWKEKHHREPNLKQKHGQMFSWETKADLAKAEVEIGGTTYRLINPDFVNNGRGRETNLIIALISPDGVDGNGQMPDGGPFLTETHPAFIDEIVRWIDDGMPD